MVATAGPCRAVWVVLGVSVQEQASERGCPPTPPQSALACADHSVTGLSVPSGSALSAGSGRRGHGPRAQRANEPSGARSALARSALAPAPALLTRTPAADWHRCQVDSRRVTPTTRLPQPSPSARRRGRRRPVPIRCSVRPAHRASTSGVWASPDATCDGRDPAEDEAESRTERLPGSLIPPTGVPMHPLDSTRRARRQAGCGGSYR